MTAADSLALCIALVINTAGCVLSLLLLSKRIDLLERQVSCLAEALRTMAHALEFLTRDATLARVKGEVRDEA